MLLLYFIVTFVLSLLLTGLVRSLMRQAGILDQARAQKRKIHKKSTPLGGGLAIFLVFFVIVIIAFGLGDIGFDVSAKKLLGIFLGSIILMIGGLLDDKYTLRPIQQILFPLLATLLALGFGIGLESITHPSGGVLRLNQWQVSLDGLGNWVVLADTVVFFWLMGMMFTTKLLDGMDGLATGIVLIGTLMIFFISQQEQWFQPEVSILALIFAGSCLGFLVWNFHPAKIFLGEGGSLFIGYILGTLAIISGSKIATTLLVMGIPILDVARVIFRRLQKRKSIFVGDSEHLHFRLLESGLGHRQTVLLLYTIAFVFGLSTLFLQTKQKLIALSFLFVLMLLVGVWFSKKDERKNLAPPGDQSASWRS